MTVSRKTLVKKKYKQNIYLYDIKKKILELEKIISIYDHNMDETLQKMTLAQTYITEYTLKLDETEEYLTELTQEYEKKKIDLLMSNMVSVYSNSKELFFTDIDADYNADKDTCQDSIVQCQLTINKHTALLVSYNKSINDLSGYKRNKQKELRKLEVLLSSATPKNPDYDHVSVLKYVKEVNEELIKLCFTKICYQGVQHTNTIEYCRLNTEWHRIQVENGTQATVYTKVSSQKSHFLNTIVKDHTHLNGM